MKLPTLLPIALMALAACGGGSEGGTAAPAPGPTNAAPTAKAGEAATVYAGAFVALDGSQSSDPDSDALSFKWTFTSKPAGSVATLNNASANSPSFIADVVGSYALSLTVNDGKVDSTAASTVVITATDPLLRTTSAGVLRGAEDASVGTYAWLGVPYAKPPIGALRWQAPVAPDAWTGTRDAVTLGRACTQVSQIFDAPWDTEPLGLGISSSFGAAVGQEDCLTINIWRPRNLSTRLPVLVYVHGGSNRGGWSGQYLGGALAAEQQVIVVSLNYRLNLFGWLNHPALKVGDADSDSGNFGTLDVVQALKFVQQNIANFGGDPQNVTIGGQSSGGSNVWSMMLSPRATGLFHKAFVVSAIVRGKAPSDSQDFANELLTHLVIKDGLATDAASAASFLGGKDNAWIKQYLYGKTAAELVVMLGKSAGGGLLPLPTAAPSILYDGVVQPAGAGPADGVAAIASGNFNNVPVLAGITNEEGKMFAGASWPEGQAARWARMWNFNPDDPASTPLVLQNLVRASFLPVDARPTGTCGQPGYVAGYNYFANICGATGPGNVPTSTLSYWQGQASALNALQPRQAKVFAYNFAWAQQPAPWNTVYGAAHTVDLPFLFGDFGPNWTSFGFSSTNKPGREALGLAMRNSLGAFMRNGDPNHPTLGQPWQAWSPASDAAKRMIFNASATTVDIRMSNSDSPVQP